MHTLTMLERLQHLTRKAVAPISGFLVSSIVIDKDGREFTGVNVEYEIPTNSICAERNALSTAFTNGVKMGDIREVHVYAKNTHKDEASFIVTPCGACRQAILEASTCEGKVFMYNDNGDVEEQTISELLPCAFKGVEK